MSSWYMGHSSSSIDPSSTSRSRRKNDWPPTAKKQSVDRSSCSSGWKKRRPCFQYPEVRVPCSKPLRSSTRVQTAKMSSLTKQDRASSTKFGSTTMSLLQKATMPPRATSSPALSEKMYRFSGRRTTRTAG